MEKRAPQAAQREAFEMAKTPAGLAGKSESYARNRSENDGLALVDSALQRARRLEQRHVDLSGRQLTRLPPSIGDLPHLQVLDLSNNRLAELPAEFACLRNLKTLRLHGNAFRSFPAVLATLPELTVLDLRRNSIGSLPSSVHHLTKLEEFDLSHNRLGSLPTSIGYLANLQLLNVASNDLRRLPPALKDLKHLTRLDVTDNRRLNLPPEITNSRRAHLVIDYYFRSHDSDPLLEAKLVLVGRGGVGKTSLVDRLVRDHFEAGTAATQGIKITPWRVSAGSDEVDLNVWDFGGQEIMHSTHQFFLTTRSLYIVVLSGREGREESDADYWLKLIESFGADSPVIVVCNRMEEHRFDLNMRGLQLKYPSIRAFVNTDCKSGLGIETLRKMIETQADALPHVRDVFPRTWFRIKEHLSTSEHDYITYDAFRSLCASHGELDVDSQDRLAGYLHTLGIALNYRDDPRLVDMHVLNPHWVTDGIYSILNSEILKNSKGELRLGDLRAILPTSRYPRERHAFLLDLMRKFELCFAFSDDDTKYLVPELLGRDEPDLTAFTQAEALRFQYRYRILPEGILPRFIVRTRGLSGRLPRWRSGTILEFDGCKAVVKADVEERLVTIDVTGPVESRRRLLAVIRSDFERIHGDIANLHVEELVPLPSHPTVAMQYNELLVLEKAGIFKVPKVVGTEIVEVDVAAMLQGVDITMTTPRRARPARSFVLYSSKDDAFRAQLETHLKLFERQRLLSTWSDDRLLPGDDRMTSTADALDNAELLLVLVSADLLASDALDAALQRAAGLQRAGRLKIVPILVRACAWVDSVMGFLTPLPRDGVPIASASNPDAAWAEIAAGIKQVLL